jgi:hypothetical protein
MSIEYLPPLEFRLICRMLQYFSAEPDMQRHGVPALASLVFQAALFGQTPISTSLVTSVNPSKYGLPVTLTATVTGGATGKVTFYDGVTVLGISALSSSQANLTTVMLSSGNRKLRAHYSGDSTHAPSSSPFLAQSVAAASSLGFQPAADYTSVTPAYLTSTGDFNNDNKLDFVIVNLYDPTVTVYLGNGDGTFRPATSYLLGGEAISFAVADFNGDGCLDLAVANEGNRSVNILLGNGDGTFQNALNIATGGYPSSIAAADFNGDGIPDLALVNAYTSGVTILLGKGDGTFQAPVSVAITAITPSVTVADFNGDGIPDLLLSGSSYLGVLLGNGDGTFQAAQTVATSNNITVSSASVADFNGDGSADILLTADGAIEVILGKGNGAFGAPLYLNTGQYSSLAIGDFNGDGKPDVALLTSASYPNTNNAAAVLPGHGDGSFGTAIDFPIPSSANGLTVADFNGDSKTDLIVTSNNSQGYSVLLGGAVPDLTISASHGQGFNQGEPGAEYLIAVANAGTFPAVSPVGVVVTLASGPTAISLSGSGWTCTLATLACSRNDALAVGASYPPIALKFDIPASMMGFITSGFVVGGGGETNTANDTASDTTFLRYPSTTTLAVSPNPVTLGKAVTLTATVTSGATGRVDFYSGTTPLGSAPVASGQSALSTALLASGVNSLHAFYSGDSQYGSSTSATIVETVTAVSVTGEQPYTSYPVDVSPNLILAADLNGDGKTDLITLNTGTSSKGTFSVLLGNGDGTFRSTVNYPAAPDRSSGRVAVIGDFNNDGKPDVAMVTNSGIYLLFGNGDGTLGSPQPAVVAGTFTTLVAADFNGDGNLDLATVEGESVLLLAGNGDGTFQPAVAIATAPSSYSALYVADMNTDGKADLVGYQSNGNFLAVILGNGDGTFQSPIVTTIANSAISDVTVGDFNGDGKPDIGEVYWGGEAVLPGNGDGTFQAPITSPLGPACGYFAIAGDFNGDGKLDIAYSGYIGSVTVSFGKGDGTFQPSSTFSTDSYVGTIVLGDFNGDGMPDFAVSNGGTSTVDVFLGERISGVGVASTHTGGFTAGKTGTYQLTVTNSQFIATGAAVTVTDALPYGFTAASMSGSGWTCTLSSVSCTRSDALYSGQSYSPITLVVNVSSGFAAPVTENQVSVTTGGVTHSVTDPTTVVLETGISVTASPNPATLGQPVLFTATLAGGGAGSASFLSNGVPLGSAPIVNGQASLTTSMLQAGRLSLTATYAGDATHGGSVSPPTAQTVAAAPASGFAALATYATGTAPVQIAAADFNRDGNLDLVTANSTAGTVSVLFGKGDGTFGPKTDYAAQTGPAAVLAGDFNNDGWPDIAVANANSGTVSILLNKGNGTFQAAQNYLAASGLTYLAASDFNGDGNVDLVVFNNYSTGSQGVWLSSWTSTSSGANSHP